MNNFQHRSPETLHDSDLRSLKQQDCPCVNSLCDCNTQAENRLKHIREESALLKQQLEELSVNHEMRSASVVATLLNWIDHDAAKLKMKNCCCNNAARRDKWSGSHMAEGSFHPSKHSTPVKKGSPETKRDATASHVDALRLSAPSIGHVEPAVNDGSYLHGVSAGSSNVFYNHSTSSSSPSNDSGSRDVYRLTSSRETPDGGTTGIGGSDIKSDFLRMSDLDSESTPSVSANNSSEMVMAMADSYDPGSQTTTTVRNNVHHVHPLETPSTRSPASLSHPPPNGQNSALRSVSAPPAVPRMNLQLSPHPQTATSIPPSSDHFSSGRPSRRTSPASSMKSYRSAGPPKLSQKPRNPTSVHQPIAVRPEHQTAQFGPTEDHYRAEQLRNLDTSSPPIKNRSPSTSVGTPHTANRTTSTISEGPNAPQRMLSDSYDMQMSSHLTSPASSRLSTLGGSHKWSARNINNDCAQINPVYGQESAQQHLGSQDLAGDVQTNYGEEDSSGQASDETQESSQRTPARSPHTVQSDFGTAAELEEFVTKLISNRRLLGEIAFQLDRRILNYIFNSQRDKKRFYGYTIVNIPQKIAHECIDQVTGARDERKYSLLHYRYEYIQNVLRPYGYNVNRHAVVAEDLVNIFGLLPTPSNKMLQYHFAPENSKSVWAILEKIAPSTVLLDIQVLFNCLLQFSKDDSKPMIMW